MNKISNICLLITLFLSCSYFSCGMSPEESTKIITSYISSRPKLKSSSLCGGDIPCCNVSTSNSCNLSEFPKDETTLVLPGGETRCIFSYSTPFAFQVIPGDSDKLLFYFQGGGACWDKVSTKLGFCTSDSVPEFTGVFDKSNSQNPFKGYTIVHVLYCTGDVYGGNVTRSYDDNAGQPVVQKGLTNAQSALDWVIRQQKESSGLENVLQNLVIMGCSAGSIGAQLWGKQILDQLRWKRAAVVPDSYAGVFPDGTMGPLVYDFGFCGSGFLSPALYKKCMDQTLTLQQMDIEFINAYKNIPYAFIQSKIDDVQEAFYMAVGLTSNTSFLISPTEFYDDVNKIFGSYNQILDNFVTYLVDGNQHCFTPNNYIYTADPISKTDDGQETDSPLMRNWVGSFALDEGQQIESVCDGTLESSPTKIRRDNTYCSSKVVPKTFTEHY